MRTDRLLLQDILDAIETIALYLPANRAAFDADPPLQSHIYRHLLILGEAVWRLSASVKSSYPHVPWKQIEGMRHVMVHDYFKVDWDIVYTTAHQSVPELKTHLLQILKKLS